MKWSELLDLKKEQNDRVESLWAASLLMKTRGNVTKAARMAEMDRANFSRIMRVHGLVSKEFRNA